MPLMLSRKHGDTIVLVFGEVTAEITVTAIKPYQIGLAINAPESVGIFRKELLTKIKKNNPTTAIKDLKCLRVNKRINEVLNDND